MSDTTQKIEVGATPATHYVLTHPDAEVPLRVHMQLEDTGGGMVTLVDTRSNSPILTLPTSMLAPVVNLLETAFRQTSEGLEVDARLEDLD